MRQKILIAAAVLHHFGGGAAAVYIQDVGADLFGHLRGHAHALRLAAKDLHCKRALVLIKAHLPFRFRIVAREAFHRNEFGNSQTDAAALFQQTPKRNIRHTRHRRKHERRIDLNIANFERFDLAHKKAT